MDEFFAALAHKLLYPTTRLHWLYLASALMLAWGCYLFERRRVPGTGLGNFLFPKSIWLHRSAISDYAFVTITIPIWKLLVVPLLLTSTQVARALMEFARDNFGFMGAPSTPSAALALLYTIVVITLTDFKIYWVHRMMHRVPWLWEFHKVHHSAEVMTPITYYRSHPVDMLVQAIAETAAIGVVTGVFLCLFPGGVTAVTIFDINAVRFLFLLFGANLRHSHIWLSFGAATEHLLISPAQHQIHHSSDSRHHHRNFGSEFAIWDWIFGTLYVTGRKEALTPGLGPAENQRYAGLWQLYTTPFLNLLSSRRRNPARGYAPAFAQQNAASTVQTASEERGR